MNSNNQKIQKVRRLSISRVILMILIIAGIISGSMYRAKQHIDAKTVEQFRPWFASYVDVTSTPTFPFEHLGSTSSPHVVLSFIVASKTDPCTSTWGTYFSLDEAGNKLDLDRRIARLKQLGGQVAISFGGALNDELSVGCIDENTLLDAYQSVIDRYEVNTIDLDLEGESLGNEEVILRRAKAIATLQSNRIAKKEKLSVWLTLPVSPGGLTEQGTKAVEIMLSNGVSLAGVNVMTMDYSNGKAPEQTMISASTEGIIQTHRQLGILYKQASIDLSDRAIWRKIGATPMIGQNDIVNEVFTLQDAKELNNFALEHGLGRISMWSANRDIPCGDNYADLKRVSDSCSGVKDVKLSFSRALSNGFNGNIEQEIVVQVSDDITKEEIIDVPDKSPYQIWQELGVYQVGVKVVWHKNVYIAKWWTKGDLPDNPVLQAYETPWQLIGPVLPGDKPAPQPTLPPGTYPLWSGIEIYQGGERVLFEGFPYQAKWWNEGESPAVSAINPDSSPWIKLSESQVALILKYPKEDKK